MEERTPKRTPPDEIFKRIKKEIGNCTGTVGSAEISGRINKCKTYLGSFLKSHPEFQLEARLLIKSRRQQLAQERGESGADAQPAEAAIRPEAILRQIFETMRKHGIADYTNTSRAMGRDMNFVSRVANADPKMRKAIDRMIETLTPHVEKKKDDAYVECTLMPLIPISREVPTWRYLCRESCINRDRRIRIEASEHMQGMLEKCRERIAKMPASTFFGSVRHGYVEIFKPAEGRVNRGQGEVKTHREEFEEGIREAAIERFKKELVEVAARGNVKPDSPAAANHFGILPSLVLKVLREDAGSLEEINQRVAQARAPAQESPHIARRVDTWRGRLFVTELGDKEQLNSWNRGMRAKRHFGRPKPKPPENGFDVAGFWAKVRKQIEASPEIRYARNALHLLGASRTNPAIELGSRILSLNWEAAPSLNIAQVAAGGSGKDVVASMRTIGEATLNKGFWCAVSIMGYDALNEGGREFLFKCANAALEKGGKFAVVSEWPVRMQFIALGFEPAMIGMLDDGVMIAVFEKTRTVRVPKEPLLLDANMERKMSIMRMCGRSFNPHSREDVLQRAMAAKKIQAALAR